jgi:hypothetical protein
MLKVQEEKEEEPSPMKDYARELVLEIVEEIIKDFSLSIKFGLPKGKNLFCDSDDVQKKSMFIKREISEHSFSPKLPKQTSLLTAKLTKVQ